MNISNHYNTITFEIIDHVGMLTVNRPKSLNALNSEVLQEFKTILKEIEDKNRQFEIRGIILTGSGDKAFIAGADIKEMADFGKDQALEMSALGQSATLQFENLSIPVIAAVNGFALGGGCEFAMCADFIYATNSAVFGQPEAKLGLIPGFGGTQRLAKFVGRNRAREILYTCRNIKADEAKEIGLVVKLFASKDEMIKGAIDTINQIAKQSPVAISSIKKIMNMGNDLTVEDGMKLENDGFSTIFTTDDMKEGTKAFLEKRSPNF